MQSLATSVIDYWPAILILIGLSYVAVAIGADTTFGRIVVTVCLLSWGSVGVVYFLYRPPLAGRLLYLISCDPAGVQIVKNSLAAGGDSR